MANLVSPGVSVTVTDESFFIPAGASTVALFFIATAAEKVQPDDITPAAGTYEYNIVRTVTSVRQSGELYGVPRFLKDTDGNFLHGDARNEYGLLALNNYLGVASMAYAVRANVNLDDNISSIRDVWDVKLQEASYVLENLINNFLNVYNLTNHLIPSDPLYKVTVDKAEMLPLAEQALSYVWEFSSFAHSQDDFFDDHTAVPLLVYANGYDVASTGTYIGFTGLAEKWETDESGSVVDTAWTPAEAGDMLMGAADDFKFTQEFLNKTSLGANDSSRRSTIVTALRQVIASNEDIRSDSFEYNLILCPGFHEVAPDMLGLVEDIEMEAFVIADTPMDMNPDAVVNWSMTSARSRSPYIAYYYPHGVMTNQFTGEQVFAPASAIAVRTIAYSDSVSDVWFAPAGTRRGLVTNVSYVGYLSGSLGHPTTIIEVALNRGQRDNMYKYSTNLNPIVFFPGRGLIVFGQKTSAPDASALDRINVVRMVVYIKRQLRKNSLAFVFEPNDQITRDSFKAVIDGFLGSIFVRRGLMDFSTLCSEANNTPDRIDRNEMWADVALKPMKAAEFIYIPIRVVNTGTAI